MVGTEPPEVPRRGASAEPAGSEPRRVLTVSELEVLRLVAIGLTSHEIAAELLISYDTVGNHLSSMRDKLVASTKLNLSRIGRNLGLL